jgi:hypothetical protein
MSSRAVLGTAFQFGGGFVGIGVGAMPNPDLFLLGGGCMFDDCMFDDCMFDG